MEGNTEHHSTKSHVPLWATVVTTAANEERATDLRAHVVDALPGWDTATRADTGDRSRIVQALGGLAFGAVVVSFLLPAAWPSLLVAALRWLATGLALAAAVRHLVPSAAMRAAPRLRTRSHTRTQSSQAPIHRSHNVAGRTLGDPHERSRRMFSGSSPSGRCHRIDINP